MPFIIRPDGDTDLTNATIHAETTLPQTIGSLTAGDYEVGKVEWAASAVTVTAALAAPVITGVPTISGTTTDGETLTATAASVAGNPSPTRTWQWERSGVAISGATSSTYTLVTADVGETITVVQTETNSEGSDTAESTATATIAAAGASTPATILGTELIAWADVSLGGMVQDAAGTTPAANGDPVYLLPDQEGGASFAAPATANRPTYTVTGSVHYLSVESLEGLARTGVPVERPAYFLAVLRRTGTNTANVPVLQIRTAGGSATYTDDTLLLEMFEFNGEFRWTARGVASGSSGAFLLGPSEVSTTEFEIVECWWEGTNAYMAVDGGTDLVTDTGNTPGAVSDLYLGASLEFGSTAGQSGFDIAGLVIVDAVPTAGQRTDLRAWASSLIA